MKKSVILLMSMMMSLSIGVVTTSCSSEDNPSGESVQLPAARITETIRNEEKKATVFGYWVNDPERYGVADSITMATACL